MKQEESKQGFFSGKSAPGLTDAARLKALRFEPSKTDPERSDVYYEDKKIGDVGTNLTGLISEYYDLYIEMESSIKQYFAKELDKQYTLKELQTLVSKQDKAAVDITLYQIGMKAFNGFKEVVKEEDTSKKFSQSKAVLKEVKHHINILMGTTVHLSDSNIPCMKHFAKKLDSIANQLEEFTPSGRVAKIPGLPALVSVFLKKESKLAKNVAISFNEAVKEYGKGPARLVKIPSVKEKKKGDRKDKKAEKATSNTKGFW